VVENSRTNRGIRCDTFKVPTPTRMPSWIARRACVILKVVGLLNAKGVPWRKHILPSMLCAYVRVKKGNLESKVLNLSSFSTID
jgi:hypothetical protein